MHISKKPAPEDFDIAKTFRAAANAGASLVAAGGRTRDSCAWVKRSEF